MNWLLPCLLVLNGPVQPVVMYSFQSVMVMKLCQGHVFFLQKQLNGIAAAISRYGYAWSAAKRLSRLFKTLLKNKGPATAVGVH